VVEIGAFRGLHGLFSRNLHPAARISLSGADVVDPPEGLMDLDK